MALAPLSIRDPAWRDSGKDPALLAVRKNRKIIRTHDMNKVKLIIAAALTLWALGANAAFVDNRTPAAGGEISVAYKGISVEDLLGEIVPQGYAIEYMSPEIPHKKIDLNGKGTWEALVARTAAAAHIKVETMRNEKVVRLSVESQPKAAVVAGIVSSVTPKSDAGSAAAPAKMQVQQTEIWTVNAGDSLRTKLDEWCERAGYRLEWSKAVDKGFILRGSNVFEGDFKSAVAGLFAAIPEELHLDVQVTKNKLVYVNRGKK